MRKYTTYKSIEHVNKVDINKVESQLEDIFDSVKTQSNNISRQYHGFSD